MDAMLAAKRMISGPTLVDRFRDAMRRTAAGVAVVTTQGPAGRGGITVSSFCSLSLEPPSVLVCIRRNSTTLQRILGNQVFAANVLAQDQSELAAAFASPATPHERRFALGRWEEGPGGPTLAGAVAHFDCKLAHVHDYGSHTIVIGEVVEAASHDARPLIYAEQGFHKLP
ncbi:MAG TPA: flavin reductase family protein [Rhodoblastus sp.]|nr:flavin reductase family protein [Rhodoblastus sp.]